MVNEYDRLTSISKNPSPSTIDDWKAIKEKEEDIYIEFKSSLRFCYHQKKVEPKLEIKCVKTISAFLNVGAISHLMWINCPNSNL